MLQGDFPSWHQVVLYAATLRQRWLTATRSSRKFWKELPEVCDWRFVGGAMPWNRHPGDLVFGGIRHFAEVVEREQSRAVAVRPKRLHGVATHHRQTREMERIRRERLVRVLVKVAHDVHLALAAGARAMAPELLQLHKTLAAIVPLDGQLVADGLNVDRSHCRKRCRAGPLDATLVSAVTLANGWPAQRTPCRTKLDKPNFIPCDEHGAIASCRP